MLEGDGRYETMSFSATYFALTLERLQAVMLSNGFSSVEWLMPQESGFYQPVAIGHVAL